MSTVEEFVAALRRRTAPAELVLINKRLGPHDDAFGIRMRDLFDVAKQASGMPLEQVQQLFADDHYEVRLGALCILDFRARARGVSSEERAQLCDLYLRHHHRITTWDMVDRAAPSVVGGHLLTHSRAPLHELARSGDPLRRRTAITATLWFVRFGDEPDVADALPVAAQLASDPDPVVHLAVGTFLKHAGGRQPALVRAFLDQHAATMAPAAVRSTRSKL